MSLKKISDILAIAPVLKYCNIKSSYSYKKIKFEVEYKTEEKKGSIKVFEIELFGSNVIHTRETDKQKALNEM